MTRDELVSYLTEHFGSRLSPLESGRFDPLFEVTPENLLDSARGLRDDETVAFDFLCCVTGVDTGERFEVVYSIASTTKRLRLNFKLLLPYESPEVDSVRQIWPAANWYERELWELYGINVRNHPNLTRFLLPDDWDQGYPMRKDWDAPDFLRLPEA